MSVLLLLSGVAVFLAVAMAFAWALILRTGRSGIADTVWSYSIGLAGVTAALTPIGSETFGPRALIVAALVAVWSLRLGTHILRRTIAGGDDPRYAELRRQWGESYPRQLLVFLEIQAGAAFVLVASLMAAANNPAPLGFGDAVGLAVAALAIIGEWVSDRQLKNFKADGGHRGEVCDTGLWSLSRHPNYFFEWLHWVSYVFIGLNVAGYPWGFATIAAPVMMYWLLAHVSGVPPLEAHMLRSRGDAFRAYQARVRAFWPIPNRDQSA